MCFISPLGRFPEDFLRERTPFTWVLYATPFHSLSLYILYISLSLSLIAPSLSISLLLPFSLSPSLSLLSNILFRVSNVFVSVMCISLSLYYPNPKYFSIIYPTTARITKLSRTRCSKTLVLVKIMVLKIQNRLNIIEH